VDIGGFSQTGQNTIAMTSDLAVIGAGGLSSSGPITTSNSISTTGTSSITSGAGGFYTSGNIQGGNIVGALLSSNGNINAAGNISTNTGTVSGATLTSTGGITATGLLTAGTVTSTGLLTAGTISPAGGGGAAVVAAQFNGTAKIGSAVGNINLALEIFHASGSLANGASYLICRNSAGSDIGGFWQASQSTVSVTASNIVYSSDYRLKHDITDLEGSLARMCALRPRSYIWNCEHRCTRGGDGFIAHELQEVVPYAVFGEKDAVDDEGEPVYQKIDVTKLIPHLVGAIQELTRRLAVLEAK